MNPNVSIILWSLSVATVTAELQVGAGQPFTDIGSALASAQPGDTLVLQAGQYPESPIIKKPGLSLRAAPGAEVVILGRIRVVSDDVTLEALSIRQWTGSQHGVDAYQVSGLTVSNCRIDGGGSLQGSASGIYVRNSTDVLITDNEIQGCRKGINIVSGHSLDESYATGIRIRGNYIHDNPADGIDLHGEYLTVEGNQIANNIDSDWKTHHPDGIQAIASTVDGYTTVRHCRVIRNVIRNHNQNIYFQGTASEADADCLDIHIANNLVYNESGLINGVDLDATATKHVAIEKAGDVHIFNNTLGRSGSLCVYVNSCKDGSVAIKNNIFCNDLKAGIFIPDPRDLQAGGLNHNVYHNRAFPVALASTYYDSLSELRTETDHEADGLEEDPKLVGWPDVSLRRASPAVDKGADLGIYYAVDFIGITRDKGIAWDIGAREMTAPATPRGFRSLQ